MQNNFNDTAKILLRLLAYIRLPNQMLLYFGCFLRFSSHLSSCSRIHLNFGKTFPLTLVVVVVHHFFSFKTTTHPFEKVQPSLQISVHLRSFLAHNLQQTNLIWRFSFVRLMYHCQFHSISALDIPLSDTGTARLSSEKMFPAFFAELPCHAWG